MSSLNTTELSTHVGLSVDIDVETLLSGKHAEELREQLERRGVLVFPKVHLTDEQQVVFAGTVGTVIDQGEKGIFKITMDEEQSLKADYLRSTIFWHIDGATDEIPTRGSILNPQRLSDTGGQTEFANTYAAWDALPEERKDYLRTLKVVHRIDAILGRIYTDPTPEMQAGWDTYQDRVHPLVWKHASGRESLVLGATTAYIQGMDLAEGKALLDELEEWATQPRFVYRHEWSPGDLLMWDNTGTMHRVLPYPLESRRLMHRTTLVGEEAIN